MTLKYSSWVPGFENVVELWNKENPDIQVEYSNVPDGTSGTYANYFNQVKAGTAPDLGFVDYSATPAFVTQDALVDISKCPGVQEALSKYLPWTVAMSQLGEEGVQYGIPQDVGTLGLFYREDLFKKARIPYPATWDEFYEAAKKIKETTGAYITNIGSYSAPLIQGLAWEHGAQWFSTDGESWTVDMTDPATQEVAELFQKLIEEDLVTTFPPSGDAYNKGLADGTIWSTLLGAWGGYYVKAGAPDGTGWRVGETPQWGAGAASNASWGGANLVVLKGSKYPAEAAQFAIWATSHIDAVALNVKNGGIFPATTDAATAIPQLTEPDPYFGDQVTSDVFASGGEKVPSWTFSPVQVSTEAAINDGMAQVIAGRKTVMEILQEAQEKTISDMKAQGLPVS